MASLALSIYLLAPFKCSISNAVCHLEKKKLDIASHFLVLNSVSSKQQAESPESYCFVQSLVGLICKHLTKPG